MLWENVGRCPAVLDMKLKCLGNDTSRAVKRILLSGAVLPTLALVVMMSSPWTENYRVLRLMGCYLPMPLLCVLYLTAMFFLSASFFFEDKYSGCSNTVFLYNARLLTLCGAFFLVIWFCMGICVLSPLVSLLSALASLASTFFACCCFARWGRLPFIMTLAAALEIISVMIMNLRVLFI